MNSKYFAMLAFSAAFLSPFAEAKPHASNGSHKAVAAALNDTQKLEDKHKADENFRKKADLIVDNLLPYLENQWVEGYYGFIYKDPIYMTTGIGTKFSIGKTKMNEEEQNRAGKGEIIVNGEVMLDQIPFRHKSTGKELTYQEKVAYATRAKATSCGGSFDGYKRHQRLANAMDVVLTREDARKVTRAELIFKIRRIRKLIQNRYKFDIFEKPIAVQMALTDIAYMAGEGGLMKFKNALAQAKAGNYSKLPNFTDCGKGRARNNMRRNFVRLAALEKSYNGKELARIKQALDKYNLDLPLTSKIENDQKLLAQTQRTKEQLNDAQKVAGGLSELIAAHTLSPTMSWSHILPGKASENVISVHAEGSLLDISVNNPLTTQRGLLNPYNNIAKVYLDKFPTLGESSSKGMGDLLKNASLMKNYMSRQGS